MPATPSACCSPSSIDTGLRRGELMGLGSRPVKLDIPNDDMIPARGHIIVEKPRTRTKGGSRIVPLVDRAYNYLKFAEKRGAGGLPNVRRATVLEGISDRLGSSEEGCAQGRDRRPHLP